MNWYCKTYKKKKLLLTLLPIVLLMVTTLISIVCLIPYDKENIKNTYTETTVNIAESSYCEEKNYTTEEEILVWISKTGIRYHTTSDCSNMKNPLQVTVSDAETRGYTPCKRCH